jgi:lysine 2,3-aminomutase
LNRVYPFYDPIDSLPAAGQAWWRKHCHRPCGTAVSVGNGSVIPASDGGTVPHQNGAAAGADSGSAPGGPSVIGLIHQQHAVRDDAGQ